MIGRGRPLRFLLLVACGWTGARIALLWPQAGSLPGAIKAVVPFVPTAAIAAPRGQPHRPPVTVATVRRPAPVVGKTLETPMPAPRPLLVPDPLRIQLALLGLISFGPAEVIGGSATPIGPGALASGPERLDPLPSPWSASAWLVARPGTGLGTAPGGSQIGGSQAGARLAYLLVPERRLALFGRVTGPLSGKGREAALGIEWQPTRAPVRIVAEHRFGLDGTRGGPGVGVVAGIDAVAAPGVRIESYGQAGVLRRARFEPYADGAVRATRAVGGDGPVRLSLGVGAWGAAQRDAQRLDLGPSATLALPVAGQGVRIAVDWRQRVAGRARPGSGLALTIGADF